MHAQLSLKLVDPRAKHEDDEFAGCSAEVPSLTIRHDEPRDFGIPPSLAEMESIAYQEFERIPEELRSRCVGIAIRVEDFADDDILDDMGIESPFDLMGLYQGIPLTQQSTLDIRHQPDIIFLYRRPILDYWCEGADDLRAVVRHVLIHEIGHHFGFSDDDMDRIEMQAAEKA